MAQELTFVANGKNFVCNPTKIERSKIYGSTEKVVLDDHNEICKAVSMDDSGTIIIPKGGLALGMVDEDLNWVERNELIVVNNGGEKVEQIPSTFSTPIHLDDKVDIEIFLDHSIATVYQLTGDIGDLIQLVGDDIYRFTFNYRNSYETNPAFLLMSEGNLFMLTGYKNDFEFMALEETAVIDSEEENADSEDFDIDFSMM